MRQRSASTLVTRWHNDRNSAEAETVPLVTKSPSHNAALLAALDLTSSSRCKAIPYAALGLVRARVAPPSGLVRFSPIKVGP